MEKKTPAAKTPEEAARAMLAALKETRDGAAACFRVIAMNGWTGLADELAAAGVKNGFGRRANEAIAQAEAAGITTD